MLHRLHQILLLVSLGTNLMNAQFLFGAEVQPGPADPNAPREFSETKSGLKYRVLRKGTDEARPAPTDTVWVHYQGTLVEGGKEFDSSYKRGKATRFPLNAVIPGWTEGIQLVTVGGMIELIIPPQLGYGETGVPDVIPANAALRFVVELLDRKPAAEQGPIDPNAPKDFTATKSGLKYRILRNSNAKKATAGATVMAHYRGWLPDPQNPDVGREFDSSYLRGDPASFGLDQVIPGWSEGVQLIGPGGMIELEVPPELGYGKQGAQGVIPPNATLRFVIELMPPPQQGPTDKDAPAEFTTTKSGLKYRILRKSSGIHATSTDQVKVHYRGWLPDPKNPNQGQEFDSSYGRMEPAEFPLNRVIPGWTEGMQLVGRGGMIELEVSPQLGYGKNGSPPSIPGNATLRFVVELLDVLE